MGIGVRGAQQSDVDWLLGQLIQFSAFLDTQLSLIGDDLADARARLSAIVENHKVLIAENTSLDCECGCTGFQCTCAPHPRLGFIAAIVTPHILNPKIRILAEMFWWVAPENRGTRAGVLLLDELIAWAKTCHVDGHARINWMTMALEAKSPVRDETLTKRGFRLQERSFLLEFVDAGQLRAVKTCGDIAGRHIEGHPAYVTKHETPVVAGHGGAMSTSIQVDGDIDPNDEEGS